MYIKNNNNNDDDGVDSSSTISRSGRKNLSGSFPQCKQQLTRSIKFKNQEVKSFRDKIVTPTPAWPAIYVHLAQ